MIWIRQEQTTYSSIFNPEWNFVLTVRVGNFINSLNLSTNRLSFSQKELCLNISSIPELESLLSLWQMFSLLSWDFSHSWFSCSLSSNFCRIIFSAKWWLGVFLLSFSIMRLLYSLHTFVPFHNLIWAHNCPRCFNSEKIKVSSLK